MPLRESTCRNAAGRVVRSPLAFFTGVMLCALGVALALGSVSRPAAADAGIVVLGLAIALIGSLAGVGALVPGAGNGGTHRFAAWPVAGTMAASSLLFSLLCAGAPRMALPPMGAIAATYVLCFLTRLVCRWTVHAIAAFAAAHIAGNGLALEIFLDRPLPIWPSFVG